MNDVVYSLWLSRVLGPDSPQAGRLLDIAPPREIYERRFEPDIQTICTPRQRRAAVEYTLENARAHADAAGEKALLVGWTDDAYPARLRNIITPPPLLYCRGDPAALSAPVAVAMVGSRRPSEYGVQAARKIGDGLAEAGVVLVSGLAAGLDSEGHKAALRGGARTVGVVAGGPDVIYPAANRELFGLVERHGAVVSEMPPGTRPRAESFLQRNRIIAGLCQAVCVLEARRRSGTISTANHALDNGRQVFAVPGSIFSPLSEGTNALLKEGATPAVCAGDILEALGLPPPAGVPVPAPPLVQKDFVTPGAMALMPYLGTTAVGVEEICRLSGYAPATVLSALAELELAGFVRRLPGVKYALAV